MSIEYLPVGIACNLKCEYCYQDPMRDASNITTKIDWSAARAQLEKENYNFTVFGGEPLLAPIEHLEEVFKFGFEKFGSNGIQTNGALITEQHIELFKKYKVSVGLSLDGPDVMNLARCDEPTTLLIHMNIELLCRAGVIPSVIITLNKHNFDTRRMILWIQYLEALGIQHLNFHILETELGRENLALTNAQNVIMFSHLYEYSKTSKITIQPFRDIERLLLQEDADKVSCIWNACDPITTNAVHGVAPDGTRSNCGRTNKDGVNWVKAETAGSERYLILHQTPQAFGGCKDCRFFAFCKGQCPGTAIDNDWRNRTVHCKVWYTLFEMVEKDILLSARLPASRNPTERRLLERKVVSQWTGSNSHGDSPHGDSPHGDAHGDSAHQDNHGDSDRRNGIEVTWI